jgi:hypothetical protein
MEKIYHVRFQVLMAEIMKMTACWDIGTCSLVERALLKGIKACRGTSVYLGETFLINFANEQALRQFKIYVTMPA